jgi:hypothetical protein
MQCSSPGLTLTVLINILTAHWIPACTSCCEDTAVLSRRGLNEIPANLKENLVTLDLSSNNITTIKKHDFSKLRQLKTINLSYNKIQALHEDSFQRVILLEELNLSYNRIVRLPPNIFRSNRNLKTLYLKKNLLRSAGESSKAEHILDSDTLTYLDVSYCNITYISSEALSGVPNLTTLRIDGNPLTQRSIEMLHEMHIELGSSYTYEKVSYNLQDQDVEIISLPRSTSTPQNETTENDDVDPVVLQVGIVLSVCAFIIVVSSYVMITVYKNRKANEVTIKEHNSVRAIQQRPLPQPPLEDNGYEVPITPGNDNTSSVPFHDLQSRRGHEYSPVPLVENDRIRPLPAADRVLTEITHGSSHNLSCSTEYLDNVPCASGTYIYSRSERNEEDENNLPLPSSIHKTPQFFPIANRPSCTYRTSAVIPLTQSKMLGSPPDDGRFWKRDAPLPPTPKGPTSTSQALSTKNVTTFCVKNVSSENVIVSTTFIELGHDS